MQPVSMQKKIVSCKHMQFQARIEDRDMQLINVTRVEYTCEKDSVVCILFVSIAINK